MIELQKLKLHISDTSNCSIFYKHKLILVILTYFSGIAVEITDNESKVCGVELPENLGILQNLPSIVCGHVLGVNAEDNLTVLDMCAAPGNKATHLATLMKNKVSQQKQFFKNDESCSVVLLRRSYLLKVNE